MKVLCDTCDKIFEVTPSRYKRNINFFCSKECEGTFNKAEDNVSCAVCGKKFHKKNSYIARVKNITCSLECLGQLRETIYLGENNPNKYSYDRFLLKVIDSEEKAYFLGWLSSDGTLYESGARIRVHNKDKSIFDQFFKILGAELPLREEEDQIVLDICSKEISRDACRHLGISPEKKDSLLKLPKWDDPILIISFIRGFFDGVGSIRMPKITEEGWFYPNCDISSNSGSLRGSIGEFLKIPYYDDIENKRIIWWGNNALDFLSKIYDSALYWLPRKRDIYHDICSWIPGIGGRYNSGLGLHFRWTKTDVNAKSPSKERASDSGFDVTAIKIHDKIGKVTLYDTGIKVQPEFGWYFDLVPRSSIIKSGYILANDLGVIDRTYTGNIMIALTKIDDSLPDLELPKRIAQLIPRPIVHMDAVEVDSIDETSRGDGGFGSTGV